MVVLTLAKVRTGVKGLPLQLTLRPLSLRMSKSQFPYINHLIPIQCLQLVVLAAQLMCPALAPNMGPLLTDWSSRPASYGSLGRTGLSGQKKTASPK
jgi:hypothetical protein